jgi:hypothetical protein
MELGVHLRNWSQAIEDISEHLELIYHKHSSFLQESA